MTLHHFSKLKAYLDVMGIEYNIDPQIVRGLDYYSKTVFEVIKDGLTAVSYTHLDVYKRQGFIFGVPVAYALGVGFIPVRKPGKLPGTFSF